MIELDSAEFFSMITPVRQMHVRPEMGYKLVFDAETMAVFISGNDLTSDVLVPIANVKHMIVKVKNEPVKETTIKDPKKTRTTKRATKAKVPDKRLVQEQLQGTD